MRPNCASAISPIRMMSAPPHERTLATSELGYNRMRGEQDVDGCYHPGRSGKNLQGRVRRGETGIGSRKGASAVAVDEQARRTNKAERKGVSPMCRKCMNAEIHRRNFLLFAGVATLSSVALGGGVGRVLAASGPATSLKPDEALAALQSGNKRYVSDPQVCQAELAQRRQEVAPHQAPWATVLSCADSRVPPELI